MNKIATKLIQAMKAVDAVEKKGRNQKQGYDYVRATDVTREVRNALNDAGIAFTYSVLSERFWDAQTHSGGTQFFCSLTIAVTFTDAESGESITAQGIGWGADTQDKAPYKAMTGALKYALRMNFMIPDDADPEASEEIPVTSKPPVAIIPKVEADKLRKALQEANIPVQDIRAVLDKYGFATCNQITEDKVFAVTAEFTALLDCAKDAALQEASVN